MTNGRKPIKPVLTPTDVRFLTDIVGSNLWPDFTISRARCLLLLAEGRRVKDIAKEVGCSVAAVAQRRRRFALTGIRGVISSPPKPGRPRGQHTEMKLPGDTTSEAQTLELVGPAM